MLTLLLLPALYYHTLPGDILHLEHKQDTVYARLPQIHEVFAVANQQVKPTFEKRQDPC